jgi:hypothetical protein
VVKILVFLDLAKTISFLDGHYLFPLMATISYSVEVHGFKGFPPKPGSLTGFRA